MAWCPKCESEYEDHVKVCAACNTNLVDHLVTKKHEYQDIAYLTNVASIHEANLIISLLSANNVPAYYKSKESGEYLQIATGASFYGVDILVPANLLDKAKEIVAESTADIMANDMNNMEEYSELKELDMKHQNKSRIIIYILILLFFVLPIMILLLSQVINLLN